MRAWIKATAIRCVRTFFTTILGVFTAGKLITEIDWKAVLLAAFSATVYVFILCLVAGLPEVDYNLPDITTEMLDEMTDGRDHYEQQ